MINILYDPLMVGWMKGGLGGGQDINICFVYFFFLQWCAPGSIRYSLLICSQSSKEEGELMSRFSTAHPPPQFTCALRLTAKELVSGLFVFLVEDRSLVC